MYKNDGQIYMIDPVGGPTIQVGEYIKLIDGEVFCEQIEFNSDTNKFYIYVPFDEDNNF